MNSHQRWRAGGATLTALAAGVALALAAQGSAATSQAVGDMTVVARGLDNPRQLSAGPNNTIYVVESGRGGPDCVKNEGGETGEEQCFGTTGAVSRLVGNGKVGRVVRGLASAAGPDGSFAGGAQGMGVAPDGTVYVAMGDDSCAPRATMPPLLRAQGARLLGRVPKGKVFTVTDLRTIECTRNPDGTDRNSNPYSVLVLTRGHEIVADAGGNTLLEVRGKKTTLLAKIPKNGRSQAVPTSLTLGPDGAYYVGELAPGAGKNKARVLRVTPEGAVSTYQTGFNAVTGVAFDGTGNLYVTEFSDNFEKFSPNGRVVKVALDGTRTIFGAGKLKFPTGALVGADGGLYVSNFSVAPAKTPVKSPFGGQGGQVVRFALS